MAQTQKYYKKDLYFIRTAMTNSVEATTVSTITRNLTLVRTIVDITIQNSVAAAVADPHYEVLLHIRPNGSSTADPVTAVERTISDIPREEMWRHGGLLTKPVDEADSLSAPSMAGHRVYVDLKSKRKLRPGDFISFDNISNAVGNLLITGTFTFIYMET